MRTVCLCVAIVLTASPIFAQQQPILASIDKAAATVASGKDASAALDGGGRSKLFWSGLAAGIAGVTTSALGLTVLKTDETSTGNAPDSTYRACVAQRDSNPIYATNQCDALKGKNLKLLWGGVAIAGAGLSMMILGTNTSAQITRDGVGLFHRVRF